MHEYATLKGTVESYLLDSKGEVEGLLLSESRQLKVPSHLRKQLTDSVSVGSAISAEVRPGHESGYGQQFQLHKWLNGSVHDQRARVIQGQIAHWLVDKDGDLRGFILTDETQVHLPKSLRKALAPRLKLGADIGVEGPGVQTQFGTVLKAKKVSLDGIAFEHQ